MRYILSDNIALRSFRLIPYAYYLKNNRNAQKLYKEEFNLMLMCDGKHEIIESELLYSLIKRGLCHPCDDKALYLTEWQKHRVCDNRYFPAINWMITGKCNYNCLHCFNAADNSPLMSEWKRDEADRFLDEAKKCGINAFTITGGEPMLHKDFFYFIEGIYNRGMYIEEINTNGYFLAAEYLERMESMKCFPLIKISFDGIGYHDRLRNRIGAEEAALRAIRMCVDRGFSVKVQTNIWQGNEESMIPTANLLDSIGVSAMRVIRTTETPRWIENSGNSLPISRYYDEMLSFTRKYIQFPHRMSIDMWQFLKLNPLNKTYSVKPVECGIGEYRDTLPVCRGNRGMVAVAANGNVYPCHQLSGTYDAKGYYLGNAKEDGLQVLLQDSQYLTEVCTTLKQLSEQNGKCRKCKYFIFCCAGCRAVALVLTGDKLGSDTSKCIFFENCYYDKINQLLSDWCNIKPISV